MTTGRRFDLHVDPSSNGTYGVRLVETSEDADVVVAMVPAARARPVLPDVIAASVSSGHRRTAVSASRKKPIGLTEEAGVRLALTILAVDPVRKSKRVDSIRHGVETMTGEEAFYWYAHVRGDASANALKALRILLAGD